ncbi:MAG: carboxypeptidase-like regulatory domain-containing protein [Candidatus Delongbacteria bacterium]
MAEHLPDDAEGRPAGGAALDSQQEAQIREEVRRQIEAADQRRVQEDEARQHAEVLFQQEQARRRIMAEEARAYYQNSPDYYEYINENGDSEWLTRKQILAREGYFDYEENVENLEEARRKIWLKLAAWLAGGLVLAGLAIWYLLDERGSVVVLCNVPGAHIIVDGQDTGKVTDARLDLNPGEHLLEVRHAGYLPADEPFVVLKLAPRGELDVQIRLRPLP